MAEHTIAQSSLEDRIRLIVADYTKARIPVKNVRGVVAVAPGGRFEHVRDAVKAAGQYEDGSFIYIATDLDWAFKEGGYYATSKAALEQALDQRGLKIVSESFERQNIPTHSTFGPRAYWYVEVTSK